MSKKNNPNNFKKIIIELLLMVIIFGIGYFNDYKQEASNNGDNEVKANLYKLSEIPHYEGTPYVTINDNKPYFSEEDYTTKSFEKYAELDEIYGRCGVAYANIGKEIMPAENEDREELSYKPTGWKQKRYKGLVDGEYLYNRCHLIGWQLTGENDNEKNLITGTRYMNVEGMLPFENQVDDYLEENSKNHVLYRVTPIFEGNNLIASGVQMEAYSVEDNGEGVCFNIYVYNVQPGIVIDYATGDSWLEE